MIIRGSNLSIFFRINLISPRSFDFEYSSFIYLRISNKRTKFLIGGGNSRKFRCRNIRFLKNTFLIHTFISILSWIFPKFFELRQWNSSRHRNSGYAIYIYIWNFVNITSDFMGKGFRFVRSLFSWSPLVKTGELEEIEFVYLVYYFKRKWR